MKFDLGTLFGMVLQTVPEPRKVARDLFALNLSRDTLWQALILVLIGSAILGVISNLIFPAAPELSATLFGNPLMVSAAEGAVAVITVFLIFWIGRAAGGTGRFEDGLMTVIWLNFCLLVVQTGVFVLSLFASGLAAMLWLMGGVFGFWVLSHFVAELHGFSSAAKVFLAILLASFVAVAALSVILALAGAGAAITAGGLGNV